MAKNADITAAQLRAILSYDPETGVFTWRERPREHFVSDKGWAIWNGRFANQVAGCNSDNRKYICICIDYNYFLLHRLAWLYMTGEWPKNEIDHIDGDSKNNIFANLREATRQQNLANTRLGQRNRSGAKGVHWCNERNTWVAQIKINGTRMFLGRFDSLEKASQAYQSSAARLFGEFARVK